MGRATREAFQVMPLKQVRCADTRPDPIQAFYTREAMANIAETTLANLADFEAGRDCANRVS